MPTRVKMIHEDLGDQYDTSTGALIKHWTFDRQAENSYLSGPPNFRYWDTKSDHGSPFIRTYRENDYKFSDVVSAQSKLLTHPHYTGRFIALEASTPSAPFQGAEAYGAQAYNLLKPTKPSFDLSQDIGELKDLPGMLQGDFKRYLPNFYRYDRAFLAWQFGWKPMINSVRNLIIGQKKVERRLNWLLHNEGKPVRSSAKILDYTSDKVITAVGEGHTNSSPVLPTGAYGVGGKCLQTTYSTISIWASARFRFWLPRGPGNIIYKKQLLRLLNGGYVDAPVLYNLIPWSWLVDWFANVGDLVENLSPGVADRLAADYFYVMEHRENIAEREVFFTVKNKEGGTTPVNSRTTVTNGFKRRVKGSPFGLGVLTKDLSGMQLAIIGALGSSRID